MPSRQTILSTVFISCKWKIEIIPINNRLHGIITLTTTTAFLVLYDDGIEYRHFIVCPDFDHILTLYSVYFHARF